LLTIPRNIVDAMIEHAHRCAPQEACGVLSGSDGRVRSVYPMTNADASSEHFSLVPREQFDVARKIRAEGQEMLAVYHSHPATPARPSPEDIRLGVAPGIVHVIVSLADQNKPAVKAFLIEDGKAAETSVRITNEDEDNVSTT